MFSGFIPGMHTREFGHVGVNSWELFSFSSWQEPELRNIELLGAVFARSWKGASITLRSLSESRVMFLVGSLVELNN